MSRQQIFAVSLFLTVVFGGVFLALDPALHNATAPNGTVSLELCAYASSCDGILAGWDRRQAVIAFFLLGTDYLFLIAYSLAVWSALQIAALRLDGGVRKATIAVSCMALLAGVCDAFENTFLMTGFLSGSFAAVAWPASLCATLKFLAISTALLWYLTVVPFAWLQRRRATATP